MSKTPRTDDREFAAMDLKPSSRVVYASFARQLETELAEALANVKDRDNALAAIMAVLPDSAKPCDAPDLIKHFKSQMLAFSSEHIRIEKQLKEALAEIERLKKFADEVLDGRDRAADKFARRIEEFNSETDILKSEIKRKHALIEQMQTAFKEILKIQRTVDLNLFDIEQVHSIAEAALEAAERGE